MFRIFGNNGPPDLPRSINSAPSFGIKTKNNRKIYTTYEERKQKATFLREQNETAELTRKLLLINRREINRQHVSNIDRNIIGSITGDKNGRKKSKQKKNGRMGNFIKTFCVWKSSFTSV